MESFWGTLETKASATIASVREKLLLQIHRDVLQLTTTPLTYELYELSLTSRLREEQF